MVELGDDSLTSSVFTNIFSDHLFLPKVVAENSSEAMLIPIAVSVWCRIPHMMCVKIWWKEEGPHLSEKNPR